MPLGVAACPVTLPPALDARELAGANDEGGSDVVIVVVAVSFGMKAQVC